MRVSGQPWAQHALLEWKFEAAEFDGKVKVESSSLSPWAALCTASPDAAVSCLAEPATVLGGARIPGQGTALISCVVNVVVVLSFGD